MRLKEKSNMDFAALLLGFVVGFLISALLLAGGMAMKVAEGERRAWGEAIGVFINLQREHTKWHEEENKRKMPDPIGAKRKAN
jgi:hypothetical protein